MSSLGAEIVNFIKNTSIVEMNNIFDKIIVVSGQYDAPKEYVEKYTKLEYGKGNKWYDLIRGTQGDLNYFKKELIHMVANDSQPNYDDADAIEQGIDIGYQDGCDYASNDGEWQYVINLDTNELEINCSSYDEPEYISLFKYTFGTNNDEAEDGLVGTLIFRDIDKKFKVISNMWDVFEKKAIEIDEYGGLEEEEEDEAKTKTDLDKRITKLLTSDDLKKIYKECTKFNEDKKCDEEFILSMINKVYNMGNQLFLHSRLVNDFFIMIKDEMAKRYYAVKNIL